MFHVKRMPPYGAAFYVVACCMPHALADPAIRPPVAGGLPFESYHTSAARRVLTINCPFIAFGDSAFQKTATLARMNAPTPPRPATVTPIRGYETPVSPARGERRWWHEALADFILANPTASQKDMAAHFGKSVGTINFIVNTDSFKAYYRQRRAAFEESLDSNIRNKLMKLADSSIDQMLATLEKKRDSVPMEILHRTSDMALRNLGYGAPPAPQTIINNQPSHVNVAVSVEDLERAREALRRQQLGPPVIESAPLGRSATPDPDKSGDV